MDPRYYPAQQAGTPQGYGQMGYAGYAQPGYPPQQQGYAAPPGLAGMQYQQPIRLARFPGDALHGGPPPAGSGMMMQQPYSAVAYSQPGMGLPMRPLQPQLSGGMRPAQQMGQLVPGNPLGSMPGYGMPQPYQGMGGGGLGRPPMPYPGAPGMQQQLSVQPSAPPPQQAGYGRGRVGSFSAGPASKAHSRAPSASAQPPYQAQPVPGPPGVNLPDSLLSPSSPGALPTQQQPSPGSRAQSASAAQPQQLVPLGRSASAKGPQGGGFMDLAGTVARQPGSPPKVNSVSRAGSAHSATGSTRGGAGGGGGARLGSSDGRLGSGRLNASAPASRVGSAGKRSAVGELDEYDTIKVAVRVRPPNAQELARADPQALFVNPNDYRQIQLAVPGASGTVSARNFAFHACLGPMSRQQDVVRLCGINQLLDAALDGFNTTVMAYGQTGSGKTYTMCGREEVIMDDGYLGDASDGLMTRSAAYLFEQAQHRTDGCRYSFRVSYLEIYNEAVYDLLKFDKKQLQVRWDAVKGFHVPDLHVKECASLEELLKAISRGVLHRRVGSHELNLESSRSHSIMTIYCDCTPLRTDDHEYGTTRFGKVSLVDLAGSERVRDSKSSGETLKETTNINRSLFMLGKVIAALAEGAQGARVPYRESKLTKLLMDSLGGSSLSLIIACCSPSATHVEETLSTLTYATRAKNIRNQPIQQVDPQEAAISALKREVRLLRAENAYLREQLFQANMPRGPPALSRPSTNGPGGGGEGGQQLPSGMVTPMSVVAPSELAADAPALRTGDGGAAAAESAPGDNEAARQPHLPPPQQQQRGQLPAASMAKAAASRPGSAGGAGPAGLSAAQASSITSEELLRRLLETQRMLVQFSRENDRLAGENDRLRAGKQLVATDYQGALEEVEWLRTKLESLESSLIRASLDATGSPPGRKSQLLEAARAAVQLQCGAGGGAPADEERVAAEGAGDLMPDAAGQQAEQESPVVDVGPLVDAADAAGMAQAGEGPLALAPLALAAAERSGAAAAGPEGSKVPLIAPELLRDPSELSAAGAAGAQPAGDPGAELAEPAAAQDAQHEAESGTGAEASPGLVPPPRRARGEAGGRAPPATVPAPAAALSHSESSELEGAEGLPPGEQASAGEATVEAAGPTLADADVTAMVTLAQQPTAAKAAAVAWVAGADEGGEQVEGQAEALAAAAERLQGLLSARGEQ